jgi:hypothetical protein
VGSKSTIIYLPCQINKNFFYIFNRNTVDYQYLPLAICHAFQIPANTRDKGNPHNFPLNMQTPELAVECSHTNTLVPDSDK